MPDLKQVLESPNTLLLYPGPSAVFLDVFTKTSEFLNSETPYTVILLDGTWMQARGMYNQNKFLHTLKQVYYKLE